MSLSHVWGLAFTHFSLTLHYTATTATKTCLQFLVGFGRGVYNEGRVKLVGDCLLGFITS